MNIRETTCRACGANIMFVPTKNGKTTPVNTLPKWFRTTDKGELFVLLDGSTRHGTVCPESEADSIGYVSHFATCPKADEFRKRGKKARKAAAGGAV